MDPMITLPYARSRVVDNLVFSSGHVPLDTNGALVSNEFAAQFEHVVRGIEATLREAGASLEDIVQLRCYLASAHHFDEFNELCRSAFPQPFPTRTTVVTGMAKPGSSSRSNRPLFFPSGPESRHQEKGVTHEQHCRRIDDRGRA